MATGGSDRFNNHPGRGGFSREHLLQTVRDCLGRGISPSTRDADQGRYGLASAKAYRREFGSLQDAVILVRAEQNGERTGHINGYL